MADFSEQDVDEARRRLLRAIERLPGVEVGTGHGSLAVALRGTRFAWFVVSHHDDGELACWIRAPHHEQEALVGGNPARYFVPPYLGPKGWVAARLDPDSDPDWDEIGALLEQGWRMGAGKRAIAAFDAANPGT